MSAPVNRTVMWLTFRQLFVPRRLVMALLLAVLPALVAALYHAHPNRNGISADVFLDGMYARFVVGVLLPLAAVLFGTGAFGLDLDEGTLVYLLVKPLRRWQVVLSRYLVAVTATALLMVPAILLPWLIMGTGTTTFSSVLSVAAGAGVGCILYSAIFIPLGIASKRALVFGLLYIVVLEEVMSNQIEGAKSLSVREYVLSVIHAIRGGAPTLVPHVSMSTVWVMGTIIFVGGLALAIRKLSAFEAAERL